jgi:hypothetical protein
MAAVASCEQERAGTAEVEINAFAGRIGESVRLFRPLAGFNRYIRVILRAE